MDGFIVVFIVESRISSIWEPRSKRKTRATRGDVWDSWEKGSEHGMEFPSNEGALLTLGFLTFAVFLIKCILVRLNYNVFTFLLLSV